MTAELKHTPGPWRAGYPDGSDPTTVMTVATREKFAKVGIRVESGQTPTSRFVTLKRDDSLKPRSYGQLPDIICEMADEDDLPLAEREGNARLAAVAPTFLEALAEAEALAVDHAHGGVCATCNDWAARLADITGAAIAALSQKTGKAT